jgi:hypothetical protein
LDDAASDKVRAICATICAAIGYAPASGKTNPQLIVCARTDIAALRLLLKQQAGYAPHPASTGVQVTH